MAFVYLNRIILEFFLSALLVAKGVKDYYDRIYLLYTRWGWVAIGYVDDPCTLKKNVVCQRLTRYSFVQT